MTFPLKEYLSITDINELVESDIDRFFQKVDKEGPNECWIWTASLSFGYGRFWWRGHTIKAHRVSWIIHYGPIPEGKLVLHKCDNKKCVNPSHLYLGTYSDNVLDREYRCSGYLKGRPTNITRANITKMKEMKEGGKTYTEIAYTFKISRQYISRLIKGERGSNAL